MELILKDVSLKTEKINKNLINANYTFKEGITFCNGLSGKILKELLFQERKIDNGIVMVSEYATKKDIGVVGWSTDIDFNKNNLTDEIIYLINEYSLNYKDAAKRIRDALLMVGLNTNYLDVYFSDLSSTELKKLSLALMLFVNPKIMILDYYDKNLCDSDIVYLRKLIHKLSTMYNKTIIICSDNISPYLSVIDNIVIFNEGIIKFTGNKNDLYDDNLYKFIDEPDIISFIKYANSKGHKLENYVDIKELIKAIYRDVENK